MLTINRDNCPGDTSEKWRESFNTASKSIHPRYKRRHLGGSGVMEYWSVGVLVLDALRRHLLCKTEEKAELNLRTQDLQLGSGVRVEQVKGDFRTCFSRSSWTIVTVGWCAELVSR
jgi:hypothetical protein